MHDIGLEALDHLYALDIHKSQCAHIHNRQKSLQS